ncbi:MAG: SprT-like domain-containing protein [Sphingobacteriales bacterium]|jgi:SprT protein
MSKKEAPLEALRSFLPEGTFEKLSTYIHEHNIHLTITRARTSVLGDYRNAVQGKNHRISVNGNLNKFAFLYTLIHEIAHLLTFTTYGHKVPSHGKEWKQQFSALLKEFVHADVFPPDIRKAIAESMNNPSASSCAEDGLLRVFRRYDLGKKDIFFVEELEQGEYFQLTDGRVFRREEKLRKRFRCLEVSNGKVYLFSPVYEVKKYFGL